jgi:hypothetical protein
MYTHTYALHRLWEDKTWRLPILREDGFHFKPLKQIYYVALIKM